MYFANPGNFVAEVEDEEKFDEVANLVLHEQLTKMRGRLATATARSLLYVFLTKMFIVLIIEGPLEKIFGGKSNFMTLAINVALPVMIMWFLTLRIKIPGRKEQDHLKEAAKDIVFRFDEERREDAMIHSLKQGGTPILLVMFYTFYLFLFAVIFSLIIGGLYKIGFSFVSIGIFLFFLSLVTFFAFRIQQTVQVYTYKPRLKGGYVLIELVMLPVVTLGGYLSQGVSRLNFLVFVFDFVLESPYKIILHFLDKWFSFLSAKKDEVVG
jgi:hypothetical protein